MTNQLLFGETVKVTKTRGKLWVKIRSLHDGYEGWLTNTLLAPLDETKARQRSEYVSVDPVTRVVTSKGVLQIPLGASLYGFEESKGKIGDLEYTIEGNFLKRPA